MSVLVWFLILMMMMMMMAVMKCGDGSAEIIRVSADSSVVLPSGLQEGLHRYDIRWTQIPHLLLNKNRSTCSHKRCELLGDGSLQFSQVQSRDSGNYTLEVFDERGKRHMTKHFLLQVKDSSSSPVAASVSICIVLLGLLLFFILFFMLRKRRSQRMTTTGHKEGNVYMVMKGYQGNKTKDEKKPEKEEEPLYVPCNPAASCQHEESVYV